MSNKKNLLSEIIKKMDDQILLLTSFCMFLYVMIALSVKDTSYLLLIPFVVIFLGRIWDLLLDIEVSKFCSV